MTQRKASEGEQGYILVVVLVLMVILMAAGIYGLRSMESDIRAASYTRKSELLSHAAEAGAAERVAQIALASDDAGSALDVAVPPQPWPTSAAYDPSIRNSTLYQVTSRPIGAVEGRPPAGFQVGAGGQTTLWEVAGYSMYNGTGEAGGEHAVNVGIRLWSRGGLSYNN